MKATGLVVFFTVLCLNLNAQRVDFSYSPSGINPQVDHVFEEDGVDVYTFKFNVEDVKEPIQIVWQIPLNGMHIFFSNQKSDGVYPDWSSQIIHSRATTNAPVVAILDNSNQNKLSWAASDAMNSLKFFSGVVEETAELINKVVIKPAAFDQLKSYEIKIRLDRRAIPYWDVLSDVADWWASFNGHEPLHVPNEAKRPVYSTWYNFHQQLNVSEVIRECKLAKSLGCGTIIVDDGWQTTDSNRGYKFTGDWKSERIPQMKAFVDSIHAIGMKFMLWYSVPFVGTGSEAYKIFKDKLLNDRAWNDSYVLDPRYPEVRDYLIRIYANALTNWGLDGFKLDFVNAFNSSSALPYKEGMDYANVDKATDRLLTDVSATLTSLKMDVLIEFRQPYVGPLMRKYGNMFRATDCPYSIVHNRVRTSQVKLLAGHTATHSDMIMWHPGEPVESAALQLLNVMFSVPQLSVKLHEYPSEHIEMLRFWLTFWINHQDVLLDGDFEAHSPHLNFPLLVAKTKKKLVAGVYSPNAIVTVDATHAPFDEICVINASGIENLCLQAGGNPTRYKYSIYDCKGTVVDEGRVKLHGLMEFNVPEAGLLILDL
jgi:alpha-galactosidase